MATLEHPQGRADAASLETRPMAPAAPVMIEAGPGRGVTPGAGEGALAAAAASVAHVFEQLAEALERTGDEQYVRTGPPGLGGTVGGHVRHCLDHLVGLLGCLGTGRLDYDHRERGTAIETSRTEALAAIRAAAGDLARVGERRDEPIRLQVMIAGDGSAIDAASSLSRELAFVLSHTIHHAAMIAAVLAHHGIEVPEGFGYAPSTLHAIRTGLIDAPASDDGTACAR